MRNEVEKGRLLKLGLGYGEEDPSIGFSGFRVLENKRSQAIMSLLFFTKTLNIPLMTLELEYGLQKYGTINQFSLMVKHIFYWA